MPVCKMSAAGAISCDRFLDFSERSTDDFIIRNIDEIIHKPVLAARGFNNVNVDNSPGVYRRRQEEIIEQIKGCELAIFNDPRIVYLSHRLHLSGTTGALSNILTGTFYYLYNHVIQIPEIQINVKADLLTLFHAGLVLDFSKLPEQDEFIIQNIIRILLEKEGAGGLFTPDWWDSIPSKFESIIKRLDRNSTMWRVFQELVNVDDVDIFTYGPYENTVEYIPHNVLEYDKLLTVPANSEKYRTQLGRLRRLFTPSPKNNNNNNNTMAALFGLFGGSRKKMTRIRRKKQEAKRLKNGKRKTFRFST